MHSSTGVIAPASDRHWYALYTRPNFEKRIASELKETGLHAYLPLRSVLRQWSDRKKWIEQPLFSCYVFVHVNAQERLLSLTPGGVVKMVSNGSQPARIPEREIEMVRRMLSSGLDPEPIPQVFPGDFIEITSGPLMGMRGVLRSVRSQQRFIVALEAIGQSVMVSIGQNIAKIASLPKHTARFRSRLNHVA